MRSTACPFDPMLLSLGYNQMYRQCSHLAELVNYPQRTRFIIAENPVRALPYGSEDPEAIHVEPYGLS